MNEELFNSIMEIINTVYNRQCTITELDWEAAHDVLIQNNASLELLLNLYGPTTPKPKGRIIRAIDGIFN